MNKDYSFRTTIKACAALVLLVPGIQQASAQEICISNGQDRQLDTSGFYWQLWSQDAEPTSCMTPGDGLTFSTRYQNMTNHLARRGLYFGDGHGNSYMDMNPIYATYKVDWQPEYVTGGNSNVSIYGWTNNPVAEFYITENWYQWNHSMPGAAEDPAPEPQGTVVIDGTTYDLIRAQRVNKPTPWGNMTFYQYVSVRQDRGSASQSPDPSGVISGPISVSEHFDAWHATGAMPMDGELYEVAFNVESWNANGEADVTELDITVGTLPKQVALAEDCYQVAVGESILLSLDNYALFGGPYPEIEVTSNSSNVSTSGNGATKQYVTGNSSGNATITLRGPNNEVWDTAAVAVGGSCASLQQRVYQFRALGTRGDERVHVLLDGNPVDYGHILSTSYETYTGTIRGEGEVSVEFANDDGIQNGRDVRLDYITVDGERRETEQMANNGAAYANGTCGGGGYTEWLHCNGAVDFGDFDPSHTITIRARGNAGGEHINLLIDGQPVNAGWWLGASFQLYTATVTGDGDINIQFDNDGGLRDVIIDWVKVDNQVPRQAENMQYNTGAYANGQCGGGSYTQWLHCNGVIGFGRISDNFN
ncbi:MAG TPA: glycoside hydrolase family 11 protein [Gammaproteobacteria bacterium]